MGARKTTVKRERLNKKEVSTSECCKPDFVRRPPKRLAVRSFIYLAEAKFPPKRDATYPESLDEPPDPLFCLAPEWVYHAFIVTFEAVSSYLAFSPLPQASPRRFIFCDTSRRAGLPQHSPAFTGNPALRCPDFPLIPERTSERPHPEVDTAETAKHPNKRKREVSKNTESERNENQTCASKSRLNQLRTTHPQPRVQALQAHRK